MTEGLKLQREKSNSQMAQILSVSQHNEESECSALKPGRREVPGSNPVATVIVIISVKYTNPVVCSIHENFFNIFLIIIIFNEDLVYSNNSYLKSSF